MTGHRIALVALLVAASCGGGESAATTTTTEETATGTSISPVATTSPQTTSVAVATTDPSAVADRAEIESYLVELSNILGEGDNRRRACEERTQRDHPVSEDPSASEVEAFIRAMYAGCLVGGFDATTDAIAGLTPPPGLSDVHGDYVAGRRNWLTVIAPIAESMTTAEDLQSFFQSPEVLGAMDDVSLRCRAIELAATGAGYVVSLTCPEPSEQAPGETVQVSFGESGPTIEPAGIVDTGPGVQLVIRNDDERPHRPVVVTLFSGDPAHLPVRDDLVDLGESGVVFSEDTDPDRGYFGLNWPEVTGENQDSDAPEVAPGGELSLVVGPGEYVVFDQTPGSYAAGGFAVLVVVSFAELQAAYVAPPNAADTCTQLTGVAVDLFNTYIDEVAHLTAGGFTASPLSMLDDLRFGALVQRTQQLGCDSEEQRASMTGQFCPVSAPEGSTQHVILERLCAGNT